MPEDYWGYKTRPPFSGESQYFKANKDVGGMAAEDGSIVLNPYSTLQPHEQEAVARNEAARLFMREQNFKFDFPVTPAQRLPFEVTGAEYAKPENLHHLQSTILSRIISGDPSAGMVTPEQQAWADKIKVMLEARKKQ